MKDIYMDYKIKCEETSLIAEKDQSEYKNKFTNFVLNENGIYKKNTFYVFFATMRFGKTRIAISHFIKELFEKTDVNAIILTSPINGIIEQKKHSITKTLAHLNGCTEFFNTDDVVTRVNRALEDDLKFVLTVTNQAAFVSDKFKEIYKMLDYGRTAVIVDECHTWTTDCQENLPDVIGGGKKKIQENTSENPKEHYEFSAVLYNLVKDISKHTHLIFGLSGTPNNQHNGRVQAIGEMKFEIVNPEFKDKASTLVYNARFRMGWYDEKRVRFMMASNDLGNFGNHRKNIKDHFNDATHILMERERVSNRKISMFCEVPKKKSGDENNRFIEDIKEYIRDSDFISKNESDAIGAVISTDSMYTFDKNLNIIEENLSSNKICEKISDENDPLRFYIVIEMMKMGVDMPNTKMFFSIRNSEKKAHSFTEYGYLTESKKQTFGRLLTPNIGNISSKKFFEEFLGDFRMLQNFHPEQNVFDIWVMDTETNKRALNEFAENCAPAVPEEFQEELLNCEEIIQNIKNKEHGFIILEDASHDDDDFDGINDALKVA